MTRRIIIDSGAERDIDLIAGYLAEDRVDLGLALYDDFAATTESLAQAPYIGAIRSFKHAGEVRMARRRMRRSPAAQAAQTAALAHRRVSVGQRAH